jgi:hypothetical protein
MHGQRNIKKHTTLVNGSHIIYCIIIYQVTSYHDTHYILPVDLVIRSVEDIYLRITHSQHETTPSIEGKDGTERISVSSLGLVLMQFDKKMSHSFESHMLKNQLMHFY